MPCVLTRVRNCCNDAQGKHLLWRSTYNPIHERDNHILLSALKACTSLRDVETGKVIHAHVITNSNIYIETALIDMYAKCGSTSEAQKVFDAMLDHDLVSWNALVLGFASNGKAKSALQAFSKMQSTCTPDARTFVAVLMACIELAKGEAYYSVNSQLVKLRTLESAMDIQSRALKISDMYVSNTLVDVYSKCGSMLDARGVFDTMEFRNVVSCNVLMLGYVENMEAQTALEFLEQMESQVCEPDNRTYVAALMACSVLAADGKPQALKRGIDVHHRAAFAGYDGDMFVANTLIDMYAKCGRMVYASNVFQKMSFRSVVPWTTMILGYVENGEEEMALRMFWSMDCTPNSWTFVAALKGCSCLALRHEEARVVYLQAGIDIHSRATECGCDTDMFVASALIDMYSKCGSMIQARQVFERMQNRDRVSWTSLISGYVASGEAGLAIQCFERMMTEGCPADVQTYVAALTACSSLAGEHMLKTGREIHARVDKHGCGSDLYVANTLVYMYTKCGSLADAKSVFDTLPNRDVVSWTTLIQGYVENGDYKHALELYSGMDCQQNARTVVVALMACAGLAKNEEGVAPLTKAMEIHVQAVHWNLDMDMFVRNSLVSTYSECGSLYDSRLLFDKMKDWDMVSWNTLLLGYVENEENYVALDLLMHVSVFDARTLVTALMACGNLALLETGRSVHREVCRYGYERDGFVANTLVDLYGKCGAMVVSQHIFDSVVHVSDNTHFTTLIAGYSRQGDTQQVFHQFNRMVEEGLQPCSVSFTALLTACGRAGLQEKGRALFHRMKEFRVERTVEHIRSVVDMLARGNRIQEAVEMVSEGDVVCWTSILSACCKWGNVEYGKLAFKKLVSLDSNQETAYTLMSNLLRGKQ